jgi:uncharacterized protein (DUF433 family)
VAKRTTAPKTRTPARRAPLQGGRIAIDLNICHGKPTIRGTRVPVTVLLAAVAGGDPIEQVADDYGVTPDDVLAAIGYANTVLSAEQHFTIRAKAS